MHAACALFAELVSFFYHKMCGFHGAHAQRNFLLSSGRVITYFGRTRLKQFSSFWTSEHMGRMDLRLISVDFFTFHGLFIFDMCLGHKFSNLCELQCLHCVFPSHFCNFYEVLRSDQPIGLYQNDYDTVWSCGIKELLDTQWLPCVGTKCV